MERLAKHLLILAFAGFWLSLGTVSYPSGAEAQFFRWFQPSERPKAVPRRKVKPKPPGDDLPPIVPRESSLPPPPDDRPYDNKLMRLAEILGAIHYLRELCGAEEGQLWRDQMKEILKNEGTTAARRAKLVNSFNDGYRGYRRTYRACTESATLASARFSTEGATIAAALAQTSVFAGGPKKAEAAPEAAATEQQAQAKPASQKPAEPEPPD